MFPDEIWQVMFAHAEAEYPAECCGIIAIDGAGVYTAHQCENIQDKLHAADPETYNRTATEAYMIDPMQQFKIEQASEKAGGRIAAFYHSHIDVGAYFSDKDQADAAPEGEPIYPGVVYPVIAVNAGKADRNGSKIFGWQNDASGFDELDC